MCLFNDRNEQNTISERPPAILFTPPTYNNWIQNYPYERNRHTLASPVSSIELERTISLTVSDPAATRGHLGALTLTDCPKTGCSHCGMVAYTNHASTVRRNMLAVSNSSYTGKLLILTDPSLVKESYNGSIGDFHTKLPYENGKACVSAHHQSRSDTELTNSGKVKNVLIRNVIPQASHINMLQKDEQSSTNDIDKKHDNKAMESGFSRNHLLLSGNQNKRNVRESSDDCRPTDKESDDGYNNENSMSDDNTGSVSEDKSITILSSQRKSITPAQSYKEASSPLEVSARSRGDSKVTQSSLSMAVQQIHRTPLPQVETTAIDAGTQHDEGLIQSASNSDNNKDTKVTATTANTNKKHNMIQCCLEKETQSRPITISCTTQTVNNNTESIDHSVVTPTPSLVVTKTTIANKLQSNISNETKQSETVKDMRSVTVDKPGMSSRSSNRSKSKLSTREANSMEQSSEIIATSNSFPGETFAACKSRPHTSDATMCTNKSFSSTVIPRATSSVPSRKKRRTKRRNELGEVGFRRSNHTETFIPERSVDVPHSSCKPHKCLACNVNSLKADFQHRPTCALSNLSYQHQTELFQVENQEGLLHHDHANYWPSEYQQVYVGSLQRDQPYLLLRQQESPQCGPRVRQGQHLPTLPEVLNLHLYHPDDRAVSTCDENNIREDNAKLQKTSKKETYKKQLEEPE